LSGVGDQFSWHNKTDAYARRSDPETSHEAAESIRPTELEADVLSVLKGTGDNGATSHELAAIMHLDLVTVSPRLRPLARKGLIIETAERREGPSGRKSIVWKAS